MVKRDARTALLGLLITSAVTVSGCSFDGMGSLPIPGTVGTGEGSYELTVELPDVGTLVENAEVKLDDVAVGTVTDLDVDAWHARATISLEEEIQLPANTEAKVGSNSLLGAAYLELSVPVAADAGPALEDGGLIPLEQGGAYPTTEQVLAATSVLLNGSGLEQLRTITVELNRALSSEAGAGVRTLIPRLNSFVGALDDQREDIETAIDRLDELSGRFADDIDVVDVALDELEPALRTLSRQRTNLTAALNSLNGLSNVSTRLIGLAQDDLDGTLNDLAPVLQALADSGDAVVRGARYLFTPPFAPEGVPNACRGDYCNLFLTLDLSTQALLENFLGVPNVSEEGSSSAGDQAGDNGGTGGLVDGLLGDLLGGLGLDGGSGGGLSGLNQTLNGTLGGMLGRRATPDATSGRSDRTP